MNSKRNSLYLVMGALAVALLCLLAVISLGSINDRVGPQPILLVVAILGIIFSIVWALDRSHLLSEDVRLNRVKFSFVLVSIACAWMPVAMRLWTEFNLLRHADYAESHGDAGMVVKIFSFLLFPSAFIIAGFLWKFRRLALFSATIAFALFLLLGFCFHLFR